MSINEKNLPDNAVKLSKDEAAKIQWEVINSWPKSKDVWPYSTGLGILSFSTTVSSLIISSHFVRRLKLRSVGKFSLYLPSIFVPALVLPILHRKMVSESILLQAECPVCTQFRSLMIQNIVGLGYPLTMAPTVGFCLANAFSTYRLPDFTMKNLPDYYEVLAKFWKPIRFRVLIMFAVHSVLAVYMANAEAYSFYNVLDQIESQYETHN